MTADHVALLRRAYKRAPSSLAWTVLVTLALWALGMWLVEVCFVVGFGWPPWIAWPAAALATAGWPIRHVLRRRAEVD